MVILGLSTKYQVTKVHRFCKNYYPPLLTKSPMTQNFKPQTKKSTLYTSTRILDTTTKLTSKGTK
jgi:hypothetical protein